MYENLVSTKGYYYNGITVKVKINNKIKTTK